MACCAVGQSALFEMACLSLFGGAVGGFYCLFANHFFVLFVLLVSVLIAIAFLLYFFFFQFLSAQIWRKDVICLLVLVLTTIALLLHFLFQRFSSQIWRKNIRAIFAILALEPSALEASSTAVVDICQHKRWEEDTARKYPQKERRKKQDKEILSLEPHLWKHIGVCLKAREISLWLELEECIEILCVFMCILYIYTYIFYIYIMYLYLFICIFVYWFMYIYVYILFIYDVCKV